MNLDDLVNMKRQRRASMRYKRDNARDELLEQLLFGNNNVDEEENGNSDEDNSVQYLDRDSLIRLYNAYLPYLIAREEETDPEESDNYVEEPTIMVDEMGNAVMTSRALPQSYPNRYERILKAMNSPTYRRSLRKRSGGYNPWRYGFGRIVPTRRDRSSYDEANKIYMIGSLLARQEGAPEKRAKRWARMSKPVIKNMWTYYCDNRWYLALIYLYLVTIIQLLLHLYIDYNLVLSF